MDKKRDFDITEFWVINKGGLPLFCFSPRKDLDPALVGGFFSAIQNFVKELVKKEEIFLECILTFTPPRLTSKDRIKQTSEQWKYLAEEWIKIKKELEEKEERKKCIEEMLFDICGETSAEGGGISITNYFRRGNVEYKNIPELKNVDLEKYRKQGSFIKRISIYG